MLFQEFQFLRKLQILRLTYKLLHVSSGFSLRSITQSDVIYKICVKIIIILCQFIFKMTSVLAKQMIFEKLIILSESANIKIGVKPTIYENMIEFYDEMVLSVREGSEVYTVPVLKYCSINEFFNIINNESFNVGQRWPVDSSTLIILFENGKYHLRRMNYRDVVIESSAINRLKQLIPVLLFRQKIYNARNVGLFFNLISTDYGTELLTDSERAIEFEEDDFKKQLMFEIVINFREIYKFNVEK